MIEIKKRRDRDASFSALRGMMNSCTRKNRYWEPYIGNARMPTVIRDYIKLFADGGEISKGSQSYMERARNSYEILTKDEFTPGIAIYANEYIIPFLNTGAIQCAAMQISYNTEDQHLVEHFLGVCASNKEAMFGLQLICYQLIVDKQRIRSLNEMDVIGAIYSTYPEEDRIIDYAYIQYKQPCSGVNGFVSAAIEGARNRGVSIDEIERVIPDNPEARFLSNVGWDFNLIAQIDSLMPGIAEQV